MQAVQSIAEATGTPGSHLKGIRCCFANSLHWFQLWAFACQRRAFAAMTAPVHAIWVAKGRIHVHIHVRTSCYDKYADNISVDMLPEAAS